MLWSCIWLTALWLWGKLLHVIMWVNTYWLKNISFGICLELWMRQTKGNNQWNSVLCLMMCTCCQFYVCFTFIIIYVDIIFHSLWFYKTAQYRETSEVPPNLQGEKIFEPRHIDVKKFMVVTLWYWLLLYLHFNSIYCFKQESIHYSWHITIFIYLKTNTERLVQENCPWK